MKKSRLTNREKMEIMVGRLVITILQSLVLMALVLGFFYVVGLFTAVVEAHTWLFIPLGLGVFGLMLKMANE